MHQLVMMHFYDLEPSVAPLNVSQLFLNFACYFLLPNVKKWQDGQNVIGKNFFPYILEPP